jgi:hypothetical protein
VPRLNSASALNRQSNRQLPVIILTCLDFMGAGFRVFMGLKAGRGKSVPLPAGCYLIGLARARC